MLERDLRLGFRALDEGIVRPDELREAMAECLRDPGLSLAGIFDARGWARPGWHDDPDRSMTGEWVAPDMPSTDGPPPGEAGSTDHDPGPIGRPRPRSGRDRPGDRPTLGGRYELIRVLATGGLGRVWLARDLHLGREVALKELRGDRSGHPDLVGRFGEEARITGRLEHPGIVPIYDMFEEDGGRPPFYTMRYVAGRTLGGAVDDYHRRKAEGTAGPLEFRELLDAFTGVCQAVAYAHSRQVLHRDLKGANVVLGEFGEVFVVDWGLARSSKPGEDEGGAASSFGPWPAGRDETGPGSVSGTPGYIAPELLEGEAATVRSDVYSLGALLYSILTGQRAYDGESKWEILQSVREREPAPPGARALDAPKALEAACLKAMARDPSGRYGSASELADEVRRWLADEPVGAYPDPPARRAARWARKHRPAVLAASVVLALGVVGLSVATAMIWRERTRALAQRADATRGWRQAEDNLSLARNLTHNVVWVVEARLSSVPGAERARSDVFDRSLGLFRGYRVEKPDDPVLKEWTARIGRSSANLHQLMNEPRQAEAARLESIALNESLARDHPYDPSPGAELALALVDRAREVAGLGRLREAAGVARRALGVAEALALKFQGRPEAIRALAASLNELASIEGEMGHPAEAARLGERSTALLGGFLAGPMSRSMGDPLLMASALHGLAAARVELGRGPEGLALLDRGAAMMTSLLAKDPDLGNASQFLAHFLLGRALATSGLAGGHESAGGDLDEAIRIWDRLAGGYRHFPFYEEYAAEARRARGALRAASGAFGRADEDLESARHGLESLANRFPEVASYRANLGRTYLEQGRLARRLGQADRARDRLDKAVGALLAATDSAPERGRDRASLEEARAELSRRVDPATRASAEGPASGVDGRVRHGAAVRGQVAAGDGDGDLHAVGQRDR